MKKSFVSIVGIVILSVFFGGCASQKAWVYKPNNYSQPPNISDKTAVILPFVDTRDNINKNRIALYLIPLMPFGWADYNVPEGQQMHINSGIWINYKPTEDFAKALAQELRNTNLFKDAFFDFKKGNTDIMIKGEIISTKYNGKIITYGLSACGPLLWFIGFPAGTVSNELSIRLTCLDTKSNQTLFSKTYSAPRHSKVSWIYALKNDFNYPSMLRDIYADFISEFRENLQIFK